MEDLPAFDPNAPLDPEPKFFNFVYKPKENDNDQKEKSERTQSGEKSFQATMRLSDFTSWLGFAVERGPHTEVEVRTTITYQDGDTLETNTRIVKD